MSHFLYTLPYKNDMVQRRGEHMIKEDGSEFKTRNEIYNYILEHPGLHLGELSRRMDIPKSTIGYHLNHLKKRERLVKKSEERYTRYYIANKVGKTDKKILNLLRQTVPREIIIFLLLHPYPSQIKISRNLGKHPTTISFHLKKLMNVDIIETIPNGNETIYRMKNPQHIYDLLIIYGESLLGDTADYIVWILVSRMKLTGFHVP